MTSLTRLVARGVLLPTFVVAVALIVKAPHGTGDGFSAGVLAATAVLLQYVAFGHRQAARRMRIAPVGVRAGLVGLILMLGVLFSGPVSGRPLLAHRPAPDEPARSWLGVEIHTATAFDLGVALLVFGLLVSVVELVAQRAEEDT